MKKIIFSLLLSAGIVSAAQAQVEIGLKVSPSIGTNRFTNDGGTKLESDGAKAHFGGGLIIDYFFGENYAFNTGLELVGKGGNIKGSQTLTVGGATATRAIKQELGLQYLQIPLAIKLFTNEIATDTRLYFMLGGEVGALIGAKVDGEKTYDNGAGGTDKYSKFFNTPEAGVLLGLGGELQMGQSTKAFAGISYHRGLTDISDKSYFAPDNVEIKNNIVALDLGLKF